MGIISEKNEDRLVREYCRDLKIGPVLARVLVKRNISREEYTLLRKDPFRLLHSPDRIFGAEAVAQAIIGHAKNEKETVFHVFADYDVDGLCSGFIMSDYLGTLPDCSSDVYYPERTEGYGLNMDWVKKIISQAQDGRHHVVVTVDNGIGKIEEVNMLNRFNIPVIITDHHEAGAVIPEAEAVCNPCITGEEDYLCGAAVAWKICQKIESFMLYPNYACTDKYILYAALGTVADVMPMTIENRAITAIGLDMMNKGASKFISALAGCSNIRTITAKDLAWTIAPCINACGRMERIALARDAFLSDRKKDADVMTLAEEMLALNDERKIISAQALEEALGRDYSGKRYAVFDARKYPMGIAGIVAGKLAESTAKPAVVIQCSNPDGSVAASCRTARNLPLLSMLEQDMAEGYIISAAGHQEACGANFFMENIGLIEAEDRKSLGGEPRRVPGSGQSEGRTVPNDRNAEEALMYVRELAARKENELSVRASDEELEVAIDVSDVTVRTNSELRSIPFAGAEIPVLSFPDIKKYNYSTRCPFRNENHIVIELEDENGNRAYAVGWNMRNISRELLSKDRIKITGTMEEAKYSGRTIGIRYYEPVIIIREISVSDCAGAV